VKMPKPAKTTSPTPLTREQAMDIAAAKTFAEMDAVNNDRSIEHRIMTEGGARFEPQPSARNSTSPATGFAGLNADMTFARGGTKYGHTSYMRSRRVGG
jgi:hypothetical protein